MAVRGRTQDGAGRVRSKMAAEGESWVHEVFQLNILQPVIPLVHHDEAARIKACMGGRCNNCRSFVPYWENMEMIRDRYLYFKTHTAKCFLKEFSI